MAREQNRRGRNQAPNPLEGPIQSMALEPHTRPHLSKALGDTQDPDCGIYPDKSDFSIVNLFQPTIQSLDFFHQHTEPAHLLLDSHLNILGFLMQLYCE
jgi:hypothetical protein